MAATKNDSGLYETDIDGEKYEFAKWGAEAATDTLLDLSGIISKPLGAGVGALFGKKEKEDEGVEVKKSQAESIGLIMEALLDRVSANKQICKTLIKKFATENVLCNGQKIVYDTHYKDRLPHLFKVVQAGVEVQFGNFFGEFLGSVGVKIKPTVPIANRASPT